MLTVDVGVTIVEAINSKGTTEIRVKILNES